MWRLLDAWIGTLEALSQRYNHLLVMRPDVELTKPLDVSAVCTRRPQAFNLIGGNLQTDSLHSTGFFWNRDYDWAYLACAPPGLSHWTTYWRAARNPLEVALEVGTSCPPPLPLDELNRTLFLGNPALWRTACSPSQPLNHDVVLAMLTFVNHSMPVANLDDTQTFVRLLRDRLRCPHCAPGQNCSYVDLLDSNPLELEKIPLCSGSCKSHRALHGKLHIFCAPCKTFTPTGALWNTSQGNLAQLATTPTRPSFGVSDVLSGEQSAVPPQTCDSFAPAAARGPDESLMRVMADGLVREDCMLRISLGETQMLSVEATDLPVYVLHAPNLAVRKAQILGQLRGLNGGVRNVTFVQCMNADDVGRLDAAQRACLYRPSSWIPYQAYSSTFPNMRAGEMYNGTLSLAIKHKIALYDIVKRNVSAALVLEDDAILPIDLWKRLHSFRVPTDADVFYLGSYTNAKSFNVLRKEPHVLNQPAHTVLHQRSCSVHRGSSTHLGAVAYIAYQRGARAMLRSVRAPADTALSVLPCGNRSCEFCTQGETQYGPTSWMVHQHTTIGSTHYHR